MAAAGALGIAIAALVVLGWAAADVGGASAGASNTLPVAGGERAPGASSPSEARPPESATVDDGVPGVRRDAPPESAVGGAAPVDPVGAAESNPGSTTPAEVPTARSPQPADAAGPSLTRATSPSPECAAALAVVEASGLDLPDQTAFRCPGSAQSFPGDRQHSGVACWDHAHFCPGQSFIAINPEEIRPMDRALQYVVAHEICHIRAYVETSSPGSEDAADRCAAAAGFPRP